MKIRPDVDHLPAFAVYNNLVPGVKVYQDSSMNLKKKEKHRKSLPNETAQLKVEETTPANSSDTPKKRKKQRKRKHKSMESAMGITKTEEVDASRAETAQTEVGKPKRLKFQEPQLLLNPFAQPKQQQAKSSPQSGSPPLSKKVHGNDNPVQKPVGASSNASSLKSPVQDRPKVTNSKKTVKQNGTVTTNSKPLPTTSDSNAKKQASNKVNESAKKNHDLNTSLSSSSSPQLNKVKGNLNKKTTNDVGSKKQQKPSSGQATNTTIVPYQDESKTSPADQEKVSELPIEELLSSQNVEDSFEHGKNLFNWLISPVPMSEFMSKHWEKAPLHIKRADTDPDMYKWIISSSKLDDVLRKNMIRFGKNIDITSYADGQRQTHNPVGRAMPAAVWDYYSNGCSVRFLNPQTYVKPLWRLNASLQEYFGTFVGANVYLTPADSQGFAPHYDDIEAFVLQIEGRKHWKLYKPRSAAEELPRVSSENFSEENDDLGEPILDVILEEGDLLYFPRGVIHQAKAVDEHSLHITISCYQTNTWGDLLKEYLSAAVDQAMTNSVEFRRGLPTDYLSFMGIAHQDNPSKNIVKRRKPFMNHCKKLIQQLVDFTTPDHAADVLGKKFMWDALPPYLTLEEKKNSTFGDGEFMDEGKVYNRCEFDPDVEVKLVRKNCIRLTCEENATRVYFTVENSMEYHGDEPQFVEISSEAENAIKLLISSYPNFVKIDDLPLKNVLNRVQLIADLWERGIVVTKERLAPVDDEDMPTLDDDDFIDDIDIGDSDESEEVAEFCGEESDDDEESSDYEEDDDDENDDNEQLEDDDDDIIDMGMDSFDDFVESVMSDGDDESDDEEEENEDGLEKSYIEEVSTSDEDVPQLVPAKVPKKIQAGKKSLKR